MHYQRWQKTGDPLGTLNDHKPSDIDSITWFWRGFALTENGCLEWQRGTDNYGYGISSRGIAGNSDRTHRMAWVLNNGPIPERLSVLHRCDNPSCGLVEHLFLGTQRDNMDDMVKKGRRRST